jgi:hypothetical protein
VVPAANPPTTPATTVQPPARALETPAVARVRMTAATAGTFTSLFILILRIKSFFLSRIRCFVIRLSSIRGHQIFIRLDSGNLARDSAREGIEKHLSDGKCEFGDFSSIGGSSFSRKRRRTQILKPARERAGQ